MRDMYAVARMDNCSIGCFVISSIHRGIFDAVIGKDLMLDFDAGMMNGNAPDGDAWLFEEMTRNSMPLQSR